MAPPTIVNAFRFFWYKYKLSALNKKNHLSTEIFMLFFICITLFHFFTSLFVRIRIIVYCAPAKYVEIRSVAFYHDFRFLCAASSIISFFTSKSIYAAYMHVSCKCHCADDSHIWKFSHDLQFALEIQVGTKSFSIIHCFT